MPQRSATRSSDPWSSAWTATPELSVGRYEVKSDVAGDAAARAPEGLSQRADPGRAPSRSARPPRSPAGAARSTVAPASRNAGQS